MNKEMEYVRFLNDIRERVEAHFKGKVKGEVCSSVKNNGITVTGLMLKGEKEQVAPNFYLDKQFVEWMRGICTMEEIAEKLCSAYREELKRNSELISKISFTWEEFKHSVFMRLVNRERNQNALEIIPHQEFLDLAVVYYYSVPISHDVMGTLLITKEHLKLLEVTEAELHQVAKSNCRRFQPVKIRCMEELLYNLARKIGVEVQETKACHPFMFVMTNLKGTFGAVSILFEEELENFAESIGKSFYILPSSVHEVILVPEYQEFCREYFAGMVKEINETQVDATEVLSDKIYYYDKTAKTLTVC